MKTGQSDKITVRTFVALDPVTVWELWTLPEHVVRWNFASDDWHTPSAVNDLRAGGGFTYRMEAKNGSAGFDFSGIYEIVRAPSVIVYAMDDGRRVEITFTGTNGGTEIVETFDAEHQNSTELQRNGWQSILDNFRKYAESR